MNSIEWLIEQLEERGHIIPDHLEETAIEMHNQEAESLYAGNEQRELALFLRWFTKHYSTTNDGQFLGWADSMGNEATMNQILDHYYKEKI